MAEVAASADSERNRIDILGIPLDDAGRDEAIGRIQAHLRDPQRRLMHVVTLNPEYVMAARRQPAFRDAISRAELVVCDGIGVLMAVRAAGIGRRIERLTGVELTDVLTELSGFQADGGVFLLGGQDAAGAADALRRRHSAARITGSWSVGGPGLGWDDESIEQIESSGASIVLVGYGAPGQVLWIERNRDRLTAAGVRIAVGIGGTLDYLSGHATPAPNLVRRSGIEWLYRLVREPWRWRRQTVLPMFALLAAREAVERRNPYRILAAMNQRDRQQGNSR